MGCLVFSRLILEEILSDTVFRSNNQNNCYCATQANSSALVKYDTRWSHKPWQVTILGPLIWSHSDSSNSQHSSKTIISRCKDLIQQILGGSFLHAPSPPSPPLSSTPPLCCVVCLLGQLWTDALEKSTALMCDWGPWQKIWSTSRNLNVMNHVVYYNNWSGSKWKHSPEYSRR